MENQRLYYKHSGGIGLLGPVLMVLFGVIGVTILSVIYGYATHWIPFIYITFFIVIGYAVGIGGALALAAYLGKVRNTYVLFSGGLILGVFAVYAAWIFWIFAASRQAVFTLNPNHIYLIMNDIAKEGGWSIFKYTPTGIVLYAIWAVEAIIIIGVAIIFPCVIMADMPFCENCGKWIKGKYETPKLMSIGDKKLFVNHLEIGDFTPLTSLEKSTSFDDFTKASLTYCEDCTYNYFLTVKSIVMEEDSEGKLEEKEKDVVTNLILSEKTFRMLMEHWETMKNNTVVPYTT